MSTIIDDLDKVIRQKLKMDENDETCDDGSF